MQAMKLHADDLILFAQVADAGSFTRAAERTGLPKATLSRRLSGLENALGERLLQRSTRRQVLTEFGERMLEHARRLADEADAAAALALHRQATPRGVLRVSLPPEYHGLPIVRVISEFAAKYPEVRLQLDLSARRVDLVAERFDVAVRAAAHLPDDATLVARSVVEVRNALYASPDYLNRCGRPQTPAELAAHAGLVLVASDGELQPWHLSSGGEHWEGLPQQTLAANSMGLLQALSVQGLGIAALSDRFPKEFIASGAIERVLAQWSLPSTTIWCVTPGRRLLPQRVQAFIDVLRRVLTERD